MKKIIFLFFMTLFIFCTSENSFARLFQYNKIDTVIKTGYYVTVRDKNDNAFYDEGFFEQKFFQKNIIDSLGSLGYVSIGNAMVRHGIIFIANRETLHDFKHCFFGNHNAQPFDSAFHVVSNIKQQIKEYFCTFKSPHILYTIEKRSYKCLEFHLYKKCPTLFDNFFACDGKTMNDSNIFLVPIQLIEVSSDLSNIQFDKHKIYRVSNSKAHE